ncbi:hypothetical protein OG871_40385 (plasmid) [Kitasatospora sp. NBC_00374]|uniref:hypothetical protein n=1 Tax=Kitasatospora sp. NBC_00374 TaxID=2975964 RepID=UPI002F90E6B6
MSIDTLPLDSNGHIITSEDDSTVTVYRFGEFGDLAPHFSGTYSTCVQCGETPKLTVTGDTVRAQGPCPYPEGITTTVTLEAPSGKLIVRDHLGSAYTCDTDAFASYNSARGQAQVIEAMAAIGCAYGPVGNSCPGLYRTGADAYVIASPRYDEDDSPSLPEEDCLASIVTDLWAYSIADLEDFKRRGGDLDSLGWSTTIVDVPPGTYRFTHHTGELGFDHDSDDTVVFAHIERIAAPSTAD